MTEQEQMDTGREMAPWVKKGAFNNYWTYSHISKASFYAMISPAYYDFMNRFVKNWLYWYDGYVPYFHSGEDGIPSTHIGKAICDKLAKKVVGGRIMFKNAGKDGHKETLCEALSFVSDWAERVNFDDVVMRAVSYASGGGTALVKLNKDEDGLWAEALRFDAFIPVVGNRGEVKEVTCFLYPFTDMGVKRDGQSTRCYYITEHRYFGRYTRADGTVIDRAPLCEYTVRVQNGSITNGEYLRQGKSGGILYQNLPPDVRREIAKDYPGIRFNTPMLLPFVDSLGCELIKWTGGVSCIPSLPFGESALANVIASLQAWDYYTAAMCTDMYTGRARIIMPKFMQSAVAKGYNVGMDDYICTYFETKDPDAHKPESIQFDLRAAEWREIRDTLIQNIAINTGVNISTIASFLSDNTARTAREVSTEENDTAAYVDEKRALIERPLNRLLQIVTRHKNYTDRVVIRWSAAGLTNRSMLAEIITQGLQGGFLSQYKAVQMFNYDDDDEQVQEEYERCKEASAQGMGGLGDYDIFGGADNQGGDADQAHGAGGVSPAPAAG